MSKFEERNQLICLNVRPMVNETLLDIAMSHADKLIIKAQSGDESAFNKLVSL